ncbi:DUF2461 domain-containing protein [Anseongella ginsenosidimutans]|nr:DUF2461 domain-containing protein [Anseongella ginsenosidimutans]
MLQNSTLDFLGNLARNNNREWFNTNKTAYLAAKEDVEAFTAALIREASRFDPLLADLLPKNCLFRIYRDTRFSKDKTPYKTHMGLWLCPSGRNSNGPGYYLHITPGASFLAGGYWMPPADDLKAIRQEIDYNSTALKQLLEANSFRKYFGGLDEEHALKTAPQGYPKDHPEIALLKLKSFTVSHPFKDMVLTTPKAARTVAAGWAALAPLNQFLRSATDVASQQF